jgi:hypothetical protein
VLRSGLTIVSTKDHLQDPRNCLIYRSVMDEFTVDAFVNRDDPVPVISLDRSGEFSGDDGEIEVESNNGKRLDLKKHLRSNIKEKFRKATGKGSESGTSIQDRLLEKYVGVPTYILYCRKTLTLTDYCSRSYPSKT